MIRRIAILVGLMLGSSLAPAQGTWSAASTSGGIGRAVTTTLQPIDSTLTTQCIFGLLNLSVSIRLTWTDTPQTWVDGYEVRQRVGAGSYTTPGTSVAVVNPAPHTYTVDVPISAAGSYTFAVRSKAQNWRSVDVEATRTVTKGLGLVYGCP